MRAEPVRAALASALLAIAVVTAACGGAERPFRIGVVLDCQGAYRELRDVELSGAELPLLARGGRLRERGAGGGVTAARVGGRPVELLTGCSESGEFTSLVASARRLVERQGADAIVAGGRFSVDGLVLRDVARRYPDVPFLAAAPGPREVTLRRAAANLYRVVPDYAQATAGLGTYAFRTLGWRRAALAVEDWVAGWGPEAAFVREFCALGGRIEARHLLVSPGDPASEAGKVPRTVDGVAVLGSPLFVNAALLRDLAGRGKAPRRLLLGPDITADGELLARAGRRLAGVVGSAYSAPATAVGRTYTRAFPGSPAGRASDPLVVGYSSSVEALLVALERAGGNPDAGTPPCAGSSPVLTPGWTACRCACLRSARPSPPRPLRGSGRRARKARAWLRCGRSAASARRWEDCSARRRARPRPVSPVAGPHRPPGHGASRRPERSSR